MNNKRNWATFFLVLMILSLGVYLATGKFLIVAILCLAGYIGLVRGGRMNR